MASVGVSALGQTEIHFVDPGVKWLVLLRRFTEKNLPPDFREFSDFDTF